MKKYDFILTDDLTVPIYANSKDEAVKKLQAEIAKKEASPIFDKLYFDYETGINIPSLRQKLGRAETVKVDGKRLDLEKEAILRGEVGSEGFTRSTKGDLAITPEGQRRLVEKGLLQPEQISTKNIVIDENRFGTAGDFADFAGAAGPILGAITALSPHLRLVKMAQVLFRSPAVSRAVSAGLGSAAGKGVEEVLDAQQGFQLQDSQDVADMLKNEFAFGTVGQGVGELGAKAFAAFFGRKAPIADIRDTWVVNNGYSMDDVIKLDAKLGRLATENDIKKAAKRGEVKDLGVRGVPSQRALGRALPGRMQAAGETIFGRKSRDQGLIAYNMAALKQLREKIAQTQARLDDYALTNADDSLLISELKSKKSLLEKADEDMSNQLQRLIEDLTEQTGGFDSGILLAPQRAELGASIQSTIKNAYIDMQKGFEGRYKTLFDEVDKFTGDKDIRINLDDISQYINQILDRNVLLPAKDEDINFKVLMKLKEEIDGGKLRNGARLDQLISIKGDLIGATLSAGLKGGEKGNVIKAVREMIDDKLTDAPLGFITKATKVKEPVIDPKTGNQALDPKTNKPIFVEKIIREPVSETKRKQLFNLANRINKENQRYAKSMEPFDNAAVLRVKKDAGQNKVDPDDVYNFIIQKNKHGDLKDILAAMPESPILIKDAKGKVIGKTATRATLRTQLLRRLFKDEIALATDPITGIVNPSRYVNNLLKKEAILTQLVGKQRTTFFQMLDEFNKLSPNLTPDELTRLANNMTSKAEGLEATQGFEGLNKFIKGLREKAQASSERLDFEKRNILKNLDTATPEEMAAKLFRPRSANDIEFIKGQLSPEAFAEVQDFALESLIKKSVLPGSNKLGEIFKPGNLERALQSYGDDTLQAMFGKDLAESLKNYARTLRITVGAEEAGGAGTLVAGALALNIFNLSALPTAVALGTYKAIFSNPRIVSLLSKTDSSSVGEVLRFVERAIRFSLTRELGLGTTELGEDITRGIEEGTRRAGEEQITKDFLETLKGAGKELGTAATQARQTLTTSLELPKVEAIGAEQAQGIMAPSLLGGSPANLDIAQRLGRLT